MNPDASKNHYPPFQAGNGGSNPPGDTAKSADFLEVEGVNGGHWRSSGPLRFHHGIGGAGKKNTRAVPRSCVSVAEVAAWLVRHAKPDGNGCLLSSHSNTGDGYPRVRGDYGHRIICEARHGPAPVGSHAMHSCDRPSCVNELHLSWGTPKDNAIDRARKGRGHRTDNENSAHCRLTNKQVEEIRSLRQRALLSRQQIAELFGVTPQHISNITVGSRRKSQEVSP